jgi:hypothetical protein
MRERGHVVNAVLLSLGLGILLEPSLSPATGVAVLTVGVPVVLGALFPDIDTSFGTHRKTFHNLATLGVFLAFPAVVGNLAYVWLGVLTHYTLDLLGNVRGMALFWPLPGYYDVPVGVNVDSPWADAVTLAVTAVELAVAWALIRVGRAHLIASPTDLVATVAALV